ncbi:MAG: FtsQ-type POTRA domain-containing protein, partial [Gammaproteobacteria bacterium]
RALPWVYRVSVRRLWPDTVRISISEQQAVARWGEDALLNPWGEVFRPAREDIPAGLPRIDGRLSRKDVLIKAFIDMNTRIEQASGGRHVARLAEDRRGAWQVVLDNGLKIELGRREQQQRLGRLLRIYRRVIAGNEARVGRIDARYSNGLAIAWQGEGHNSRGEQ